MDVAASITPLGKTRPTSAREIEAARCISADVAAPGTSITPLVETQPAPVRTPGSNAPTNSSEFPVAGHDASLDLRFSRVFEAAAIGIAICNSDGRILEGNAALARLLGYEPEELAGLDPRQFHAADSTAGSRLLAELLRGERDSFAVEKRCRRKAGPEFWGRLTVSLAHNADRDPAFLVVLLEDATARKQLEEQLHQGEKMELIGRLTGGVVHDFNNLLTGFLLYCDLLLSELEPGHRLRRRVEEIRQAGEQGAALTQQLLAISRKHKPEERPIRLNDVVSSTRNLLRRLIGEQIELVVTADPAAGMVRADAVKLRQVLLNLVVNARDALKHGGKIMVRTRAAVLPADLDADRPRPAVSLVVEDNGCGMNAETRAHLFEPFFTTKQPGEGTGMGLATVHRIVTEDGGAIEVASEPGRGTRIEVFFPAIELDLIGSSGHRAIGSSEDQIACADRQATRASDVQIVRSPDEPITRSPDLTSRSPDHPMARSDDAMTRSLPAHQYPSSKGEPS